MAKDRINGLYGMVEENAIMQKKKMKKKDKIMTMLPMGLRLCGP